MTNDLSFLPTLGRIASRSESDPRAQLEALVRDASPQFQLFLEEMLRSAGPVLLLEREGLPLATFNLGFGPQQTSHLQPGRYVLRLSTGRVLWEADLGAEDLFWEARAELPLAAASEVGAEVCSRNDQVGPILVRVIPGYKGGTLRVEPAGKEAP